MRQIIPFKKELLLKTKVSEITSISLEHSLLLNEDNKIKGEFYITGDYKMTEASINREKFNFTLPFEIGIDSTYKKDSINIDIDNFYYEIVNDDSIQVNIDVFIDGEKEEKKPEDTEDIFEVDIERSKEETSDEDFRNAIEADEKEEVKEKMNMETSKNVEKQTKEQKKTINQEKTITESEEDELEHNKIITPDILNTESFGEDTYVTYYVYIVKEEDTLNKVIEKFNVTKDQIEDYNDITDIKPGMKLIIPSPNE